MTVVHRGRVLRPQWTPEPQMAPKLVPTMHTCTHAHAHMHTHTLTFTHAPVMKVKVSGTLGPPLSKIRVP